MMKIKLNKTIDKTMKLINADGTLNDLIKEQLKEANTIKKDFPKYERAIQAIFHSPSSITNDSIKFLGGFVEGEGSINVSAKKLNNSRFGLVIDPEFSLTQHAEGFCHHLRALSYFKTGRIRHKVGSNATLVFTIDNRESLLNKVVPFYNDHVNPYSSPAKIKRLYTFSKVLKLLNDKAHLQEESFKNDILPLWASMRKQQGNVNEAFENLKEAQDYVTNFVLTKKSKSEE